MSMTRYLEKLERDVEQLVVERDEARRIAANMLEHRGPLGLSHAERELVESWGVSE